MQVHGNHDEQKCPENLYKLNFTCIHKAKDLKENIEIKP